MKVCGKEFSAEDIALIKGIIAENQQVSRRKLSQKVCERLNWYSLNGKLKEMSCRVALLKLHQKEIITMPQVYERPYFNTQRENNNKRDKTCLK